MGLQEEFAPLFQGHPDLNPSEGGVGNDSPALGQPAWDNSQEYDSLQSPAFTSDYQAADALIQEVRKHAQGWLAKSPESALARQPRCTSQAGDAPAWRDVALAIQAFDQAVILNGNCQTFVRCQADLDGREEMPKQWSSRLTVQAQNIKAAIEPVHNRIQGLTEAEFEALVATAELQPHRFRLSLLREKAAETLTEREETLILRLSNPGLEAWSNLYNDLISTTRVPLRDPESGDSIAMGLAAASNLLSSPSAPMRQAAAAGIRQALADQENTYCSILNALADWRLQINRARSEAAGRPIHYLDPSLFAARMTRQTLEAMMTVLRQNKGRVQKALLWKAERLGQPKLEPWDLGAPFPQAMGNASLITFADAMTRIQSAFSQVDPVMGEFAAMMAEREWIDGRVLPNKRPGAYCTKFLKSRSPRVFMSYSGSFSSCKTLAHELGHAFHNWVMRDLSFAELAYPMTLAETASIFCETILTDAIERQSQDPGFKEFSRWTYTGLAESFLLNIPMRFEFEDRLHRQRAEGILMPKDLCGMMLEAGKDWYGEALTGFDEYFWASKLHFYLSRVSFYNYPYTFGFLFAQGILSMRKGEGEGGWGSRFFERYRELLRDTGRMKTEDLAAKHLGVELRSPAFWQRGVDQVLSKLDL